ncbi:hypothetical protein CANARDRAFT_187780, partial [[Candida] arabinofermentans NRRL YB-2248]
KLDVISIQDLDPTEFELKYVLNRKPCIINGIIPGFDLNKFKMDQIVKTLNCDEYLQVEKKIDGGYGSGANRLKMKLGELIDSLQSGNDQLYLTTQYDEDDIDESDHESEYQEEDDSDLEDQDEPSTEIPLFDNASDFSDGDSIDMNCIKDDFDELEDEDEDADEDEDEDDVIISKDCVGEDIIPDSPSSESSSTPSSTTSTAATSIADSQESTKAKKLKDSEKDKEKAKKANKAANRTTSAASGISTTVPIQSERPRPSAHSTLDDDVLFAIFEILYDHDPKTEGMTVKQICDILIEKHPEMAKLSSKTSNLVSAKLNAYVKRVEKGEKTIVYALSRDWADASPKRMVYVYRGLLAEDYHIYVQQVLESQKALEAENGGDKDSEESKKGNKKSNSSRASTSSPGMDSPMEGVTYSKGSNGISPQGLELNSRSPFMEASIDLRIPELSIPYSAAPVTALISSLQSDSNDDSKNNGAFGILKEGKNSSWLNVLHDSDSDDDSDDVYDTLRPSFTDDDEENELYSNNGYYRRGSMIVREKIPSSIGKRSKSMSFVNSKKPKTGLLTAAAATPRIPKNTSIANSPTAAAAVAALRAAALNSFNSPAERVNSITRSIMSDTSVEPSISMKWLETVRSGFLAEEVGTPEDISLAELDTLFT